MNPEVLKKLSSVSVLVVEDDERLCRSIVEGLSLWCQEVAFCMDGIEGVDLFSSFHPDCVITDIHLPGQSGIRMSKEIRLLDPRVPILIMTAFGNDKTELDSVEVGSYLYLKKPVVLDELLFAVLLSTLQQKKQHPLGRGMVFDPQEARIKQDSRSQPLTRIESRLLSLLLSQENQVVSIQTLIYGVWGDAVVSDAALRAHIMHLRKKSYPELIRNVQGLGYRLEIEPTLPGL